MGGKKGKKSKKKKTKAQKMAVANKAKYGGTAKAAAANKKSMQNKAKSYTKTSGAATAAANNKANMRAKAKANYTASQAAKSTKKSGISGIGPVKSGSSYAASLSTATNAPSKKTTGIGPYADGAKYAAALKASPPVQKPTTKSGMLTSDDTKIAMDNLGGPAAVIGGLGTMTIMGANAIKNTIQNLAPKYKEKLEKRVNPDADKLSAVGDIGGLGIGTGGPNYFSIKSPESFGAPSQAEVDKAAGITAGGLNIGGSGFTPKNPSGGTTSRAISDGTSGIGPVADGGQYARNVLQARFPGASPNSAIFQMDAAQLNQPGGPFNQTGPGGPEPEADYTSYQPGSFYNQSDTNMNPTNFLRSTRNVVTTPFRALGINNRLTNMLIPKSNEAIQDARDQRGPRPTLTRRGGGGGARLPVAPLTPEEILLPEQVAAAQTGPAYQQAVGQTGLDPNRLLQIQQQAYAQAFNPYNPMTVGGFNPMFRFFGRRAGGLGRGAFRKAFRRD